MVAVVLNAIQHAPDIVIRRAQIAQIAVVAYVRMGVRLVALITAQ